MHTIAQIKLQDVYHGGTLKGLKQYMTWSRQTLVSWTQSRALLPDKNESLLNSILMNYLWKSYPKLLLYLGLEIVFCSQDRYKHKAIPHRNSSKNAGA